MRFLDIESLQEASLELEDISKKLSEKQKSYFQREKLIVEKENLNVSTRLELNKFETALKNTELALATREQDLKVKESEFRLRARDRVLMEKKRLAKEIEQIRNESRNQVSVLREQNSKLQCQLSALKKQKQFMSSRNNELNKFNETETARASKALVQLQEAKNNLNIAKSTINVLKSKVNALSLANDSLQIEQNKVISFNSRDSNSLTIIIQSYSLILNPEYKLSLVDIFQNHFESLTCILSTKHIGEKGATQISTILLKLVLDFKEDGCKLLKLRHSIEKLTRSALNCIGSFKNLKESGISCSLKLVLASFSSSPEINLVLKPLYTFEKAEKRIYIQSLLFALARIDSLDSSSKIVAQLLKIVDSDLTLVKDVCLKWGNFTSTISHYLYKLEPVKQEYNKSLFFCAVLIQNLLETTRFVVTPALVNSIKISVKRMREQKIESIDDIGEITLATLLAIDVKICRSCRV